MLNSWKRRFLAAHVYAMLEAWFFEGRSMYAYETSIRRAHIHTHTLYTIVKRPTQIDAQTALWAHRRAYSQAHTYTHIHAVTFQSRLYVKRRMCKIRMCTMTFFLFFLRSPQLGSSLFHSFLFLLVLFLRQFKRARVGIREYVFEMSMFAFISRIHALTQAREMW